MSSDGKSDPPKQPKVYPSSSAFMEGRIVYTDYDSGCLRKIGFNAFGVKVPFDSKTADVGAENEANFERELVKENVEYKREHPFTVNLAGGVLVSGRIDFVTSTRLIELKSTRSTNKRTKLRAGAPSTENVAQLVAYMFALERDSAELIYTYINEEKNTKENYPFTVKIEPSGQILINDEAYRYDTFSYLSHRSAAARVVSRVSGGDWRAIVDSDRPANYDSKYASPCNYCPFRFACAKLDRGEVTGVEGVLESANESVSKHLLGVKK